jgi:hypothetical protein
VLAIDLQNVTKGYGSVTPGERLTLQACARAPLVGGATLWIAGSVVAWTLLSGAGTMILFQRNKARV